MTNIFNNLQDQYDQHNIEYSLSGNIIHLTAFNSDPGKIQLLSQNLFTQGILTGIQKSHGKWLRLKLPTSLSNRHFEIIEKIFHTVFKHF